MRAARDLQIDQSKQGPGTFIGLLQIPDAINRDGGKRVVPRKDVINRDIHRRPDIRMAARIRGLGRKTGRHQHHIMFSHGHLQGVTDLALGIATGVRLLVYRKVMRPGIQGEVKLTEALPFAS